MKRFVLIFAMSFLTFSLSSFESKSVNNSEYDLEIYNEIDCIQFGADQYGIHIRAGFSPSEAMWGAYINYINCAESPNGNPGGGIEELERVIQETYF